MACSSCAKKAALRNSRVAQRSVRVSRNLSRKLARQALLAPEETPDTNNQNIEPQNEQQSDLS